MFVSITCQLLQENNLLCSQRNTQRKLVLIKLILKINIQWWIHLSLKCINHHMETIFKLLTLHVKVHVLIMSFPLYLPVEKKLFVFPKKQDDETRNNKVTIKWQHPMVDSSISQIFHSSHGNHGQNSNSLGKGIDSDNAHPSLAYLGKQFLYFQSSMLRNLIMLKLVSKTNRLWHTLARP